MRISTTLFMLLAAISLLACSPMRSSSDTTEAKPIVKEKHIGGDLYRRGVHIHHHPERK